MSELVKVEKSSSVERRKDMAEERSGIKEVGRAVINKFPDTNRYNTSNEERIAHTPLDGWTGERGNSKCLPVEERKGFNECSDALKEYRQSGVYYKNGVVNFSYVAYSVCSIDHISIYRHENFKKARELFAEDFNRRKIEGKSDWTQRDVAKWQVAHKYTIHECSDGKTCQLVPTAIHDYFKHCGGVAENK